MPGSARSKDGSSKVMGPLEQEILDVLWKRGEATGKAVHADIKTVREIAITTVLTVLERLAKKGYIRKSKGESVFVFRPAFSKDEFAKEVSNGVLRDIFEISRSGACASFVDTLAETDPLELDKLSAMIEHKKKELAGRR